MPFVLVRVDDRLIHGQVTVAWGASLSPECIVLVNDEICCCDWRCALYADGDSMGVPVSVVTREGFAEGLKAGEWDDVRAFVIDPFVRNANAQGLYGQPAPTREN
jgi:mannose/fructose/N-acetylgalactosamine-specific phosphotransferase system component IIB